MKVAISKMWLNKKYIAKLATRWTGIVFSILGFIGTVAPLSDIFSETWKLFVRIACGSGVLVLVWVIAFLACGYWFSRQKRIEIFEASNDCHVYVQYGDVFAADEVNNSSERRNIIIPVNRCFDTVVDDDLVSSRTLHGIAFNKLYRSEKYNQDNLNKAIQKDLKERQGLRPQELQRSDKRKGNLERYELASVAEIQESDNCVYFFLGLSTFDYDLSASTTQQEYVTAMQKLLEYCYKRSQQFPIVMPLIGAGLSRTKYEERAILEYLVKLLKMNKDLINSDIHIVVRNSGKETIPITEL